MAKLAHLARLNIPTDEQTQVASELNNLFKWIDQLNEVDVTGVEPLSNVNDMPLRWREDVVTDGNKVDEILSNAPAKTAGFFTVPKVIE